MQKAIEEGKRASQSYATLQAGDINLWQIGFEVPESTDPVLTEAAVLDSDEDGGAVEDVRAIDAVQDIDLIRAVEPIEAQPEMTQ